MTFKDLKTQLSKLQPVLEDSIIFERLRNKPFWIWDQEQHRLEDIRTRGDCCFNHIIGLPVKEGKSHALYSYEREIYDLLQSKKYLSSMNSFLFC